MTATTTVSAVTARAIPITNAASTKGTWVTARWTDPNTPDSKKTAIVPRARRKIVAHTTGAAYPSHVDDLRLYALLEAIRSGVPPWRVATYYLDSATFRVEDVTEDLLHQACDRVIDGVGRIIELQLQRRPAKEVPNPACRWCPARATCDGARLWAEIRDEQPETVEEDDG